MAARYDVSQVPLQGGYVARQCPVRAQNDALQPAMPLPVSPALQRRFDLGNAFEAGIQARFCALHSQAEVMQGHGEELEAVTAAAMHRRVPAILGGRLPADPAGRRLGKPDLLLAAAGGGYRAVDIKWHMQLETISERARPAVCSEFASPGLEDAATDERYAARKREGDLLQLAHYQRMLEAHGLAAKDGRFAGIIGTERRIVWYDLDAPIWQTPSLSQGKKLRSTIERYDFEFAFRLDVIAVAQEYLRDPTRELLVVPVRISECGQCPWWDYCRTRLEDGDGDVSLLPRIGWDQWKIHRDHGTGNRRALAALDSRTARLVAAKIDLAGLRAAVTTLPPGTPLESLPHLTRKKAALRQLSEEGVVTAGDLLALDAATAAYADAPMAQLPLQIDQARALLGPDDVYRKRGVVQILVPRADIEVDVDMENVEDGCYLWGAFLSDRAGSGIAESGYRAFVTWESMSAEAEAGNSLRFWRWLTEIRARCLEANLSFAAYCYNASAENLYLRRLGQAAGIGDEVEEFIKSPEWVDMFRVFENQLLTGGGNGLKRIAPLAGHHWDVDEAGGGESMVKHDLATGEGPEAEAAREWLLAYNRDDVRATLALRDWLEAVAPTIKPVEVLQAHTSQVAR